MSFWDHFISWVDGLISVKGSFWFDLRGLAWLPILPFAAIAAIWFDNELVRQSSLGLGFILCVVWTVFLFRRRSVKKANWVEPTRFVDQNGGY